MLLDLSSLEQSVKSLENALKISKDHEKDPEALKEVLRAGVIQNFEFTYELSWKFMKRWLEHNLGSTYVDGLARKELFRIAFENHLISRLENWFKYHQARNETTHIYNRKKAKAVFVTARKFLKDVKELLKNLKKKNVRY